MGVCGLYHHIVLAHVSMKYKMSLDGMRKEILYNNIRKADYALCDDYLEGLEITSCDYRKYSMNTRMCPMWCFG